MSRLLRMFRVGKWKNFKGYDLEGNMYFERPNPLAYDQRDPRSTKRVVEYKIERPLSEYRFEDITPQWSAWLRHTRREPPTLDELAADRARQADLEGNVFKLEQQYREERERKRLQQPQAQVHSNEETVAKPDLTLEREREEREFQRKKRIMLQSPLEAFRPLGQQEQSETQSWNPVAPRKRG